MFSLQTYMTFMIYIIFFDLFIDFPQKSKYGISRDFVKAFDIEFIKKIVYFNKNLEEFL
jgi:hypothetical protein